MNRSLKMQNAIEFFKKNWGSDIPEELKGGKLLLVVFDEDYSMPSGIVRNEFGHYSFNWSKIEDGKTYLKWKKLK